jgi:hypothetical protein
MAKLLCIASRPSVSPSSLSVPPSWHPTSAACPLALVNRRISLCPGPHPQLLASWTTPSDLEHKSSSSSGYGRYWQRLLLFSLLPMLPPGHEDPLGHTCSSGRRRPPLHCFLNCLSCSLESAPSAPPSNTKDRTEYSSCIHGGSGHKPQLTVLETLEPCQVDARGSQTALRGQAHPVNKYTQSLPRTPL